MTQRYELGEILGRGGMATVYRAYDNVAEMDVAIKVLHSHLIDDQGVREAFEREAAIMGGLDHPSIARVYELITVDGAPAMVLDLYEGGDVHQLLMRRGKLSEQEATDIAGPILDALEYAHRKGVIHRDIKPHNILLNDDGEPVLIDFGIGQNEEVMEAGADAQLGTVEYMAPERIDGLAIDGRSDLYSLGITLFQLVCGHVPYRADSAAAVMRMHRQGETPDPSFFESSLSDAFSETVQRALELHPEDRFDRADEMKAALSEGVGRRQSIERHARWERLCEEVSDERSLMAAEPGDEEWVVFVGQHQRAVLLPSHKRALAEIFDAYQEHYVGHPRIDLSSDSRSEHMLQSYGIARGLTRSGAQELARRLAVTKLPISYGRRFQASRLLKNGRWLVMLALLPVFFILMMVVDTFFVYEFLNRFYQAYPSLSLGVLFATWSMFLGSLAAAFIFSVSARAQSWAVARMGLHFALDFSVHKKEEDTLIEPRHATMIKRVRSPRIRESLDRVMSNALHLREALRRRGVAEGRLRRAVDGVTNLTEDIISAESSVAQIRPALLVQEISEIDRQITAAVDEELVDTLLDKKELLRGQLEARDTAQQRLQSLAQRLLSVASEMNDLVQRYWVAEDQGDLVFDFDQWENLVFSEESPEEMNSEKGKREARAIAKPQRTAKTQS